jgi:hypothetical protein
MDWTSSARVRLLAGVLPLGLRFLLFGAEKSALRSRNFPTALALDFHPYPYIGRISVWGLLRLLTFYPKPKTFTRCLISSEFLFSSFRAFLI